MTIHFQCLCGRVGSIAKPEPNFITFKVCDSCSAVHTLQWDSPKYLIHKVEKRLKMEYSTK